MKLLLLHSLIHLSSVLLRPFHEAPLTSLSDSPLISPITNFSWSSSHFTVWFTFHQSYYELFLKLLTSLSDSPFISPITNFSWSSSYFTVVIYLSSILLRTFHEAPLTSLSDSPFVSPITNFSWSSSYFTVWFTFHQSYYELFMKLLLLHCLIYL